MSDIKLATYQKYYALGQRAAMAKLANPNLPEPSFSAADTNSDPVARNSKSLTEYKRPMMDYSPDLLNPGVDKYNPPLSPDQMKSVLTSGHYRDGLTGRTTFIPTRENNATSAVPRNDYTGQGRPLIKNENHPSGEEPMPTRFIPEQRYYPSPYDVQTKGYPSNPIPLGRPIK
jgi:hypothetical protein